MAAGDEAVWNVSPPLADLVRSPNSARKPDDLRFTGVLRCFSTALKRYADDAHCSRLTANSRRRTSAVDNSSASLPACCTSESLSPLAFNTSSRSSFLLPPSTTVTRTSLPSSTSTAHTACTGGVDDSARLACWADVAEAKRTKAVVGVGW